MIVWLDHRIFGNGFGLRSPFFDDRYHWLGGKSGELYTYSAGFGAQLRSFQWTHPRAGERRRLGGYDFVVVHSTRRWFRVTVSWSWVDLPKDVDQANAALRNMEAGLGKRI